jgi:hypothetical protein
LHTWHKLSRLSALEGVSYNPPFERLTTTGSLFQPFSPNRECKSTTKPLMVFTNRQLNMDAGPTNHPSPHLHPHHKPPSSPTSTRLRAPLRVPCRTSFATTRKMRGTEHSLRHKSNRRRLHKPNSTRLGVNALSYSYPLPHMRTSHLFRNSSDTIHAGARFHEARSLPHFSDSVSARPTS